MKLLRADGAQLVRFRQWQERERQDGNLAADALEGELIRDLVSMAASRKCLQSEVE